MLRSPIEELERKKYFLGNWLKQRQIDIPLIDFVVFAYNNELLIENLAAHRIAFSYEVPNKLRALEIDASILNENQVQQLANELTHAHRVFEPHSLNQKYQLSLEELEMGVTCHGCNRLTMQWGQKMWQCQACGYQDKASHLNTLQEWYYINGKQLTNRQFRQFSRIHSRHTAKRLLANPYTELSGKNKSSIYQLSPKLLTLPTNLSL